MASRSDWHAASAASATSFDWPLAARLSSAFCLTQSMYLARSACQPLLLSALAGPAQPLLLWALAAAEVPAASLGEPEGCDAHAARKASGRAVRIFFMQPST